ncbi:MAG: cold-shock protein [bacterium]
MSYYLIYSTFVKYDEAVESLNPAISLESDPERLAYSVRLALDKFIRGKGKKPEHVKRVIRESGFGFVSAENETEVFFHRSALEGIDFDALGEDDSVELNLEKKPKGPRAMNIRVIKA